MNITPSTASYVGPSDSEMRMAGFGPAQSEVPVPRDEPPWTLIGVDEDPLDGWSATWDTAEAEPGPWWLRVTVFDVNGHSDSDATEVWVAER